MSGGAGVDGGERGGASSVEMALLWSVLLACLLAVVQVALLSYAGQVAFGAAQDGLRTGRAYGTADIAAVARRDAEDFLARAGGTLLTDTTVAVTVDPGTGLLRVRVSGTALSVVPGVSLGVDREAVGGLERITP
ncbi:MAG: pilus assembly protein [Pseudonocardiales bacterium]|nr:pilus assembly protein [Pseudonocardiales bacterium]